MQKYRCPATEFPRDSQRGPLLGWRCLWTLCPGPVIPPVPTIPTSAGSIQGFVGHFHTPGPGPLRLSLQLAQRIPLGVGGELCAQTHVPGAVGWVSDLPGAQHLPDLKN